MWRGGGGKAWEKGKLSRILMDSVISPWESIEKGKIIENFEEI